MLHIGMACKEDILCLLVTLDYFNNEKDLPSVTKKNVDICILDEKCWWLTIFFTWANGKGKHF